MGKKQMSNSPQTNPILAFWKAKQNIKKTHHHTPNSLEVIKLIQVSKIKSLQPTPQATAVFFILSGFLLSSRATAGRPPGLRIEHVSSLNLFCDGVRLAPGVVVSAALDGEL